MDIYITRQPVYDRDLSVFGYQLLYHATHPSSDEISGDSALNLLNSLLDMGLNKMVGDRLGIIDFSQELSNEKFTLPFSSQQILLKLPTTANLNEQIVEQMKQMVKARYKVMIHDHQLVAKFQDIRRYASIIMVDFQATTLQNVIKKIVELKKLQIPLMALNVDNYQQMGLCNELKINYVQGDFFNKPNIVKGKKTPANRLSILKILEKLQKPHVTVSELEKVISQDVTISYKLLRYVNSAAYAIPRKVESVRHAIVYLGNEIVKNCATMVLLSSVDDKPSELIQITMIRSKMCGSLAKSFNKEQTESFATVGLFSILDALIDKPMPELLAELPLTNELKLALEKREGKMGQLLTMVIDYEKGEFSEKNEFNVSYKEMQTCYIESVEWAQDLIKSL
ncbi:MAG: HDOD domain-containing protein [Methylococcales bacterium]|nr:HDOD domain-containing protein [Methylococcales bacterium]